MLPGSLNHPDSFQTDKKVFKVLPKPNTQDNGQKMSTTAKFSHAFAS